MANMEHAQALGQAEKQGVRTLRALRILMHLAECREPARFKDVVNDLWGFDGSEAALSRNMDALERARLALRTRPVKDRRACLLTLTPAGFALARAIKEEGL